MTEKHTPGPWEAHKGVLENSPTVWDVTSRHNWSGFGGETPQGWFVATVHEVTNTASAEANARLIAAAPEMFRALQALNGGARPSNWDDDDIDDAERDAWRQLDAAIALATQDPRHG